MAHDSPLTHLLKKIFWVVIRPGVQIVKESGNEKEFTEMKVESPISWGVAAVAYNDFDFSTSDIDTRIENQPILTRTRILTGL